MSLQFNCPYCQLLMSAESNFAGGQVQCPNCRQLFMIGGAVPVVPVVQARSVPPVQAPTPSAPAAPSRPVAPGPQRPGQPRPPSTTPANKAGAKAKAEGNGTVIAAIGGVLLLGVGLIYGGVWFIGKMEQNQVSQFELPPEVKARDAARQAQLKKEADEQANEEAKSLEGSEEFLAKYVCNGNTSVAHELVVELKAIDAHYQQITADSDSSNDPKDLLAFFTKELQDRADKNNVLHHWLGGRTISDLERNCLAVISDANNLLGGGDDLTRAIIFSGAILPGQNQLPSFIAEGGYRAFGTGFFISADGWLLTNQHVVANATEVDVRDEDGSIRRATVVKAFPKEDVALLKTKEPAKNWLRLGGNDLDLARPVFTVGFPQPTVQGVEPKFTDGSISSTAGMLGDRNMYQISVPIQPGNSGGPLVDKETGEAVGITTAHLTKGQNVNYAIKASVVNRVLQSIPEASNVLAAGPAESAGAGSQQLVKHVEKSIVMVLVK